MQHARGVLLSVCCRDLLLPWSSAAVNGAAASSSASQVAASAPLLLLRRCLANAASASASSSPSAAAEPMNTTSTSTTSRIPDISTPSSSSSISQQQHAKQQQHQQAPLPMRTRLVLAALRSSDGPLTSHDLYARGRELYPGQFPASRAQFKQLVAWLKRAGWVRTRPATGRNQSFVLSVTPNGLRQSLDANAESWQLRLARKEAAAVKARIQARPAE